MNDTIRLPIIRGTGGEGEGKNGPHNRKNDANIMTIYICTRLANRVQGIFDYLILLQSTKKMMRL